jgi:hypothetical protein
VLFLLTQDIPHKKVYTRSERAKLAAAAIAVVKRSDLVHTDCFLLHEPVSDCSQSISHTAHAVHSVPQSCSIMRQARVYV